MKFTHRYSEPLRMTTTAGGIANYQYSTNGMYDPNITGVGHQPYYFDQIGSLYNHYCVIKSKIMVQLIPVVASAGCQSLRAILSMSDGTTFPTNLSTAVERPRSTWVVLSHISNTFGPQNKLSLTWDGAKIFGPNLLGDNLLQGDTTSNPTEQSYFQFQIQDIQGAGIAVVDVHFIVEYTAIWTEMANTTGS